ncbi:MAG: cytochrome c, partial [Cyclobacteriaceae bacterium]
MKKLNQFFAIIFLFSIFFACTEKGKTYDRPRDIWVFRSVLDEQARMVTVALSKDMWVTYDAKTANLYKAWKGGVNFDGAVYTTVHGPQPKSEGYAYMSDEPAAMRWFIIENGKRSVPELQYRGHKFIEGQVAFQYEFKSKSGQIAKVSEIPEVVKRGRQNGLSRTFSMDAPEGVQVGFATKISSLVNERDLSSTGVFQITSKELINYDLGS